MAREKTEKRKRRVSESSREMTRRRVEPESIERYYPSPEYGLSTEQVKHRIRQGYNNGDTGVKTKSEKQIIKENLFTFFNILNFILAAVSILTGNSFMDITFLGTIVWNILIGCVQGIRSKRTIDKLSLISTPKVTVIRDSQKGNIAIEDIVLDDIILLSSGNQICSDSVVVEGECEVNESLITGESDPITKKPGDHMLSGSFIVSGSCSAQVEHVGRDNYATKITGDAGYVKKRNSQIMDSIDRIIKFIGFGIIPIGLILFIKQLLVQTGSTAGLEVTLSSLFPTLGGLFGSSFSVFHQIIADSVKSTVAALIGMIPEGLVLLTSVVFAVSTVRLAASKTLSQDLYCVETLARVDTLCLDKTGTITEGTMQVDELVPFEGYSEDDMKAVLNALVNNLPDDNPTFLAVKDYLPEESDWICDEFVSFSSARKWSGASFPDKGTFVMGAGEFILFDDFSLIKERVESYSKNGQRVLVLVGSNEPFEDKALPAQLSVMGLVIISDKIRREAPRTLRYFADQGVDLKVISGDNAVTVANIAKRAGLKNADKYVDATTLVTDEDIEYAVQNYAVFGRVTPQQKLAFVKALKAQGRTVAMTGDGVNDVLALKESDCSIAMASGSDAAKTVSSLVLLDSNFASMPKIVAEGRRSINNLQRSASLYLSKTLFSALISILFIFINYSYPFAPRHLSLISWVTIGIPSFILALEPNKDLVKGKFLTNVLKLSVPAGLTMTANVIAICALGASFAISNDELTTLAVVSTTLAGFLLLFKVCQPLNGLRATLCGTMVSAFIIVCLFLNEMFALVGFTLPMFMVIAPVFMFAISLFVVLTHLVEHVFTRREDILYEQFRNSKKRKHKKKATAK